MLVEHTGELECTQPRRERVESVMAGAGEGGLLYERRSLEDEGSTHVTSSSSSITALPAGEAAASS